MSFQFSKIAELQPQSTAPGEPFALQTHLFSLLNKVI